MVVRDFETFLLATQLIQLPFITTLLKSELIETFGATRDSLIAEDLGAWVELNEVQQYASIPTNGSSIASLSAGILTTTNHSMPTTDISLYQVLTVEQPCAIWRVELQDYHDEAEAIRSRYSRVE
jgi:hypothetical protein